MRHRRIAALLLPVLAACGQTGTDTRADVAAIEALIERTAAANNAADTTGWVALFDADAVYMPPGMPEVTGVKGLTDVAAAGFGPYAADVTITPSEIQILGDWAFARSQVGGTVTPRAGGEPVQVDVKQLVLYRRQSDGSWKIARLMVNRNS